MFQPGLEQASLVLCETVAASLHRFSNVSNNPPCNLGSSPAIADKGRPLPTKLEFKGRRKSSRVSARTISASFSPFMEMSWLPKAEIRVGAFQVGLPVEAHIVGVNIAHAFQIRDSERLERKLNGTRKRGSVLMQEIDARTESGLGPFSRLSPIRSGVRALRAWLEHPPAAENPLSMGDWQATRDHFNSPIQLLRGNLKDLASCGVDIGQTGQAPFRDRQQPLKPGAVLREHAPHLFDASLRPRTATKVELQFAPNRGGNVSKLSLHPVLDSATYIGGRRAHDSL